MDMPALRTVNQFGKAVLFAGELPAVQRYA